MSSEVPSTSSSASARSRTPNVRFATNALSPIDERTPIAVPSSQTVTPRQRKSAARTRASKAPSQRGRRKDATPSPAGDETCVTPPGDKKRSAVGIKKGGIEIKKEPEIPEEDKKCCICLDEPGQNEVATVNGCAHVFCFGCIEKWSERENSCPLCKSRFTKIERVHKHTAKKRRKGDPPRPRTKNSKRVNHRDQRTDFVGNPLQGLFASLEGVNRNINNGPFAEIILSGRNGRVFSFTSQPNTGHSARVGNRVPTRVTQLSMSQSEEHNLEREIEAQIIASHQVNNISSVTEVSDEERQYIETFEHLLTPPLRSVMGPNSRLHVTVGGRNPYQSIAASGNNLSGAAAGANDDLGMIMRRVRAVIDGLSSSRVERFSGRAPAARPSNGVGESPATAIEIDDSESEE
eukprot:CAMPEP_0172501846 /NCGR_PEP_ID=MMETSP1066-20121228/154118_1 /TAXON_ID=671091 /ORGANISM="Coscinodiscus wailesii, Strain CCMP2513" /LENGTH=405 /DNA_ID=CAMNT_0013276861 /DNA_START=286 /DNA_END=1503 /DNA_ORIENTATION=+